MDHTEIIALGVVALAAFLLVRHFLKSKGTGCCPKDCLKPSKENGPDGKKASK